MKVSPSPYVAALLVGILCSFSGQGLVVNQGETFEEGVSTSGGGRSLLVEEITATWCPTCAEIDPELVQVVPQAKRAHQGWRYLENKDAPADFGTGDMASLPAELAEKLAELGL